MHVRRSAPEIGRVLIAVTVRGEERMEGLAFLQNGDTTYSVRWVSRFNSFETSWKTV